MATEKQSAANRENAQKSPGPKNTHNTRYNAEWHGRYAKRMVLKDENQDEYQAHSETFHNKWQPVDTEEERWTQNLADRHWELMRYKRLRTEIMDESSFRDTLYHDLETLTRLETRAEKSLIRSRKELVELQKLRGKRFDIQAPHLLHTNGNGNGNHLVGEPEANASPLHPILYREPEDAKGPKIPFYLTQGEVGFHDMVELARKKMQNQPYNRGKLTRYTNKIAEDQLAIEELKAYQPFPEYPDQTNLKDQEDLTPEEQEERDRKRREWTPPKREHPEDREHLTPEDLFDKYLGGQYPLPPPGSEELRFIPTDDYLRMREYLEKKKKPPQ